MSSFDQTVAKIIKKALSMHACMLYPVPECFYVCVLWLRVMGCTVRVDAPPCTQLCGCVVQHVGLWNAGLFCCFPRGGWPWRLEPAEWVPGGCRGDTGISVMCSGVGVFVTVSVIQKDQDLISWPNLLFFLLFSCLWDIPSGTFYPAKQTTKLTQHQDVIY